jgi:hypothetical protein
MDCMQGLPGAVPPDRVVLLDAISVIMPVSVMWLID